MVWRSGKEDEREGVFTRLEEQVEGRGVWGHETEVRGGKVRGRMDEISLEEMTVPVGGIRVKDEVVVTSSDWIDYKDRIY